jgi:hypothetical protein
LITFKSAFNFSVKWAGVFVLALVTLALIFLLLLDTDVSRPYLATAVDRATGLDAKFNRDIDIDYFPDLTVIARDFQLTRDDQSARIDRLKVTFRYADLIRRKFFPTTWQMTGVRATLGRQDQEIPVTIPDWPDLPRVDQLNWQDIVITDRPIMIKSITGQIIPDQSLAITMDGEFGDRPMTLNWDQTNQELKTFDGEIAGMNVKAKGKLQTIAGNPVSFTGPIELSGGEGDTIKYPVNLDSPLNISAELNISADDGIQLTGIELNSGAARITGNLTYFPVHRENRYQVSGQLTGKKIPIGDHQLNHLTLSGEFVPGEVQLDKFELGPGAMGQASVSYDPGKNIFDADITISGMDILNMITPAGKKGGKKQESNVWPVNKLKGWSGDVTLTAENLRRYDQNLGGIIANMRLDNNQLTWQIEDAGNGFANGDIDLSGGYDFSNTPAKFTLSSHINDIHIDPFTTNGDGGDARISAPLSLNTNLTATGKSGQDLRQSLNGKINLVVTEGRLLNSATDIWVTSIFSTILPDGQGDQVTNLNCAVGRFDVADGVAKSYLILIDTDQLSIVGDGRIDFANKSLNIVLDPRSKSIQIGTLDTGARITGSWHNPKIGPDLIDLSSTVGSLIFGIANPIGLVLPLVDLGLIENNPCADVLDGN